MRDPGPNLVFLAGRLEAHDAPEVEGLADRLRAAGLGAEIVCLAGGPRPKVVECPGLGRHWQRSWAARRLRPKKTARPDLLHALGMEMAPAAIALAEHWQVPYVLTIDEFLPPGGRLRLSRKWCRALVATGADLAEDLRLHLGVPESRIAAVSPGLRLPEHPATPGVNRVPVIGAAGPMDADSGFWIFLEAACRVIKAGIDAEFVVAGSGRDEGDLRQRAERLGIGDRVTFAGDLDFDRDATFWKVLDVFCRPALAPDSGRPLRAAMSRGIPVVASAVPGLRPLVAEGRAGRLVPPDDPDALAAEVLALLADPAAAADLGRMGRRQIAEEFDPGREAVELAALYRQIVGAPAGLHASGFAAAVETFRS